MNGRPLTLRQTIRLLVGLTILAWATQTLFHQWGFSAPPPEEHFATNSSVRAARLELRREATIYGREIHLKQVCRWSSSDDAAFAPLADLVIGRFDASVAFTSLGHREIKSVLNDAGLNIAMLQLSGATSCTVTRGDAQSDSADALNEWTKARQGENKAVLPAAGPVIHASTTPTEHASLTSAATVPQGPTRSLSDLLRADAAQRLQLAPDDLQITFASTDQATVSLAEPQYTFAVSPRRVRDLGQVIWDVTISGAAQKPRTVSITGTAQAWRRELVVERPLAHKQIIKPEDVAERRTLADRMPTTPLLDASQAINQLANRELKPGTVITAAMVDPVPLAKPGQLISVNARHGVVQITTVARAMEGGAYGEAIRVRNETTRDVYTVVLTGPQEASLNPIAVEQRPAPLAAAR